MHLFRVDVYRKLVNESFDGFLPQRCSFLTEQIQFSLERSPFNLLAGPDLLDEELFILDLGSQHFPHLDEESTNLLQDLIFLIPVEIVHGQHRSLTFQLPGSCGGWILYKKGLGGSDVLQCDIAGLIIRCYERLCGNEQVSQQDHCDPEQE